MEYSFFRTNKESRRKRPEQKELVNEIHKQNEEENPISAIFLLLLMEPK